MGAGFLLVGCGGLDLIFVPFARPRRIYDLSGPHFWRGARFLAEIEPTGFAMACQSPAPAIPPAASGHFRNYTYIGSYWGLDLSAEQLRLSHLPVFPHPTLVVSARLALDSFEQRSIKYQWPRDGMADDAAFHVYACGPFFLPN